MNRNRLNIKSIMFLTLGLMVTGLLLSGCSSTLKSKHITKQSAQRNTAEGITYYLGRDVVEIELTEATKHYKIVDENLNFKGGEKRISKTVDVKLATVPDVDELFVLELDDGAWSDDTLNITLSANGLLKGVNSTSKGKAGAFVKNLTKFVFAVLPVAAALPAREAWVKRSIKVTYESTYEGTKLLKRLQETGDREALKPVFDETNTGKDLWRSRQEAGDRDALLPDFEASEEWQAVWMAGDKGALKRAFHKTSEGRKSWEALKSAGDRETLQPVFDETPQGRNLLRKIREAKGKDGEGKQKEYDEAFQSYLREKKDAFRSQLKPDFQAGEGKKLWEEIQSAKTDAEQAEKEKIYEQKLEEFVNKKLEEKRNDYDTASGDFLKDPYEKMFDDFVPKKQEELFQQTDEGERLWKAKEEAEKKIGAEEAYGKALVKFKRDAEEKLEDREKSYDEALEDFCSERKKAFPSVIKPDFDKTSEGQRLSQAMANGTPDEEKKKAKRAYEEALTRFSERQRKERKDAYDRGLSAFDALDPDILLFILQSTEGKSLWNAKMRIEESLKARLEDRNKLLEQVATADPNSVKGVKTQLQVLNEGITRLEEQRGSIVTAFDSAKAKFLKAQGVEEKIVTESAKEIVQLTDLPPTEKFNDFIIGALKPQDIGRSWPCPEYVKMQEICKKYEVLVTSTPATWTRDSFHLPGGEGNYLYYRPTTWITLSTFRVEQDAENKTQALKRIEDNAVGVLHPKAPLMATRFRTTNWGDRKITLGFNDQGRLTTYERSDAATADIVASELAAAAQSLTETYATALESIKKAKEAQRAIELDSLKTQKEELEARAAILEKQIQIEGMTVSKELLIEKAELEARKGVVENRLKILEALESIEKINAGEEE